MISKRRKGPKQRSWGLRALLLVLLGSTTLVSLFVGVIVAVYLMLDLPQIDQLKSYAPPMVTQVLDSEGRPLAYWYREKRWPISLYQMTPYLPQAFLSAEDARFYEHPGIDFMGVLRAMIKNVEAGSIVQGASTITQQVTRSLLLTRQRSWIRKLKEAILAWQIDAALTKNEILTIYLNQIYLGNGAYGVEAAARTYFAKHASQLNLAECAILAGLPQAPSRYNPARHLDAAKRRQAYVLRRMVEEGYITPAQAAKAKRYPIRIHSEELNPPAGSLYFLAMVRKELEGRYGKNRLLTDGLTIVTTLDSRWQQRAARAVETGLKKILARHRDDPKLKKSLRAALLSMDAHTGAVRALWGGRDFNKNQYDLATQARMQPGSAFKPIVYSAAMSRGIIGPQTIIVDEPVSLPGKNPEEPWEPENFDKKYMGPITVRTALTYSRNIISVKIAKMVGLAAVRKQARLMGITVPLANNLSIALGSSAIPLIQMVEAYSTFPNRGRAVTPQFIQMVKDRSGNILEELEPRCNTALDPITAYQMTRLLTGVVQDGTGRRARKLGVPAGGKTGTTDNYKDAWFIGFTPTVVTGVWVGRRDKLPLGRLETGGRAACPIWVDYMRITIDDKASHQDFDVPLGIALVAVDRRTGEIVTPDPARDGSYVWEALRQDDLPALHPSSGFFRLPSWLKSLGDFFR